MLFQNNNQDNKLKGIKGSIKYGFASFWNSFCVFNNKKTIKFLYYKYLIFNLLLIVIYTGLFSYLIACKMDVFIAREKHGLESFENFLSNMGATLTGFTAIFFAILIFSTQQSYCNLPYRMFKKVTGDYLLIFLFLLSMICSISISFSAVVVNAGNIVEVSKFFLATLFSINLLLIFAYGHALSLINPMKQLNLMRVDGRNKVNSWCIHGRGARFLYENEDEEIKVIDDKKLRDDLSLTAFFRDTQDRSSDICSVIDHGFFYARVSAEKGDYEVSYSALKTVVKINRYYVTGRGNTFYKKGSAFDDASMEDEVISSTLEGFRHYIKTGLKNADEKQIEQALEALCSLVSIYMEISSPHKNSPKHYADTAAQHLADAVCDVPQTMPAVLMVGIRLLRIAADTFWVVSTKEDGIFLSTKGTVSVVHAIEKVGKVGVSQKRHHALTLMAIENLSELNLLLLGIQNDIDPHRDRVIEEVQSSLRRLKKLSECGPDEKAVS